MLDIDNPVKDVWAHRHSEKQNSSFHALAQSLFMSVAYFKNINNNCRRRSSIFTFNGRGIFSN